MGDDDNAARRPSGSRAAGWMICKARPWQAIPALAGTLAA